MNLNSHLHELISTEEMVCLPDFGGFITKQVSAHFDSATHIFTPPTKQIAFNERLNDNGLKFINYLIKKENLTFDQASEKVNLYTSEIKNQLETKNEFNILNLGTLYFSKTKVITFKTDSFSNTDPENFGLPQILIKYQPILKTNKEYLQKPKDRKAMSNQEIPSMPDSEENENEIESDSSEVYNTHNEKPTKKQGSLMWLYIITPLVLFGGLGTFLGVTTDGRKVLANMHLIKSAPIESDSTEMEETATEDDLNQESSETTDETTNESFDDATSAEETIKKTDSESWGGNTVDAKQEEISKTEDVKLSSGNLINGKSGRYFIIVGGFSSKRNAVRLREKLISDGLEAKVISPMAGSELFRVSLGDYSDKAAAHEKANVLKSDYGNELWIMQY
jgi:cell division protein FtsN